METIFGLLRGFKQQKTFLQGSHQSFKIFAFLSRVMEDWRGVLEVIWTQLLES